MTLRAMTILLCLGGCAADGAGRGASSETSGPAPAGAPAGRADVAPPVPVEPPIFAEVLGPVPTRRPAAPRTDAARGTCVEVRITVARSAGRSVESVTAAVPGDGEPVVVRSRVGSGWSVALAVTPPRFGAAPEARVAFDVSWARPDGPPRFPGIPADVPRDGSAGEVQFALQGTLTSGLRSFCVLELGRPTALAAIPLGQEEATFTVTVEPETDPDARADVAACDEHLAARLREILEAGKPTGPGRDVRAIELVQEGADPAGFVCGTDATPGSQFTATRPAGEYGGTARFAAADLRAPGSAAYLIRDAAWVTGYVVRDGRVAPVVSRLRSGFAWVRDAEGWTSSESVVVRSTTPRPVTLPGGGTLWADVLRVAPGPRVLTSAEVDELFAEAGATSRR